MPTEEKQAASIRMDYGPDHGAQTFTGLVPDVAPLEAYITAAGINTLQARRFVLVSLTVNSRLRR